MRYILLTIHTLFASPALAQMVMECDPNAIVHAVPEIRKYANGAISTAIVNLGTPEAGENYLLIRHPAASGEAICSMVRFDDVRGFAYMHQTAPRGSYDPARGLTLQFEAIFVLLEDNFQNSILMDITINQATGGIGIVSELGSE